MESYPIDRFKNFSELPLDDFDKLTFSVYLIDFGWNYLFVNDFVRKNLGEKGKNLIGKNMWKTFPQLSSDVNFQKLKANSELRVPTKIVTISPINFQRLSIFGHPLEDCYYFSATILPDKDALINEIRGQLLKSTR